MRRNRINAALTRRASIIASCLSSPTLARHLRVHRPRYRERCLGNLGRCLWYRLQADADCCFLVFGVIPLGPVELAIPVGLTCSDRERTRSWSLLQCTSLPGIAGQRRKRYSAMLWVEVASGASEVYCSCSAAGVYLRPWLTMFSHKRALTFTVMQSSIRLPKSLLEEIDNNSSG